MSVSGWILFGFIAFIIICIEAIIICASENIIWKIISGVIATILIIASLFGLLWYYKNTASGQREIVDQRSNFNGGLERTVTVYTATGDIIARYTGKIDIENNDGGYVIFDFQGKRYMYYNCFVEIIGDINK